MDERSCSHISQSLTIKSSSDPSPGHGSQRRHYKEGLYQWSPLRARRSNKETEKEGHMSGADGAVDQDLVDAVQAEIDVLNKKRASRASTLMKADNFLRYVLLHSTSGNPNIMVRRIMRTSSSDSDVVTDSKSGVNGRHLCRISSTRAVTLLKQIMTPTEWKSRKNQPMFSSRQSQTLS